MTFTMCPCKLLYNSMTRVRLSTYNVWEIIKALKWLVCGKHSLYLVFFLFGIYYDVIIYKPTNLKIILKRNLNIQIKYTICNTETVRSPGDIATCKLWFEHYTITQKQLLTNGKHLFKLSVCCSYKCAKIV